MVFNHSPSNRLEQTLTAFTPPKLGDPTLLCISPPNAAENLSRDATPATLWRPGAASITQSWVTIGVVCGRRASGPAGAFILPGAPVMLRFMVALTSIASARTTALLATVHAMDSQPTTVASRRRTICRRIPRRQFSRQRFSWSWWGSPWRWSGWVPQWRGRWRRPPLTFGFIR